MRDTTYLLLARTDNVGVQIVVWISVAFVLICCNESSFINANLKRSLCNYAKGTFTYSEWNSQGMEFIRNRIRKEWECTITIVVVYLR